MVHMMNTTRAAQAGKEKSQKQSHKQTKGGTSQAGAKPVPVNKNKSKASENPELEAKLKQVT